MTISNEQKARWRRRAHVNQDILIPITEPEERAKVFNAMHEAGIEYHEAVKCSKQEFDELLNAICGTED